MVAVTITPAPARNAKAVRTGIRCLMFRPSPLVSNRGGTVGCRFPEVPAVYPPGLLNIVYRREFHCGSALRLMVVRKDRRAATGHPSIGAGAAAGITPLFCSSANRRYTRPANAAPTSAEFPLGQCCDYGPHAMNACL